MSQRQSTQNREELIQKLCSAKQELKHAGPIHRRDLMKHIHRLETALRCVPKD